MKTGRIFVISAPSGSGKTTIAEKILSKVRGLAESVSFTTRPSRRGEKDRKDYFYLSRSAFEKQIKKGNLLEWEENFGYLYGTPKRFVTERIKSGKDVLLSIDVKGAMRVKKQFPASTLIFIKPPSLAELSKRLILRKRDREDEIAKRLKLAKKELAYAKRYNYVVVNRKLNEAVKRVISIIKKERE